MDVNKIGTALLHGELLLAEGNEKVFHQPPVEKGAELVDPGYLEKGEVANTGQGSFEGADQTFALVEINEYVDFVAGAHAALHVGFGHENFAKGAAVEVGSVVGEADDAQGIIIAYL